MPIHPLPILAVALALSGVGLLGGPLILSLGRGRALTAALVEGLTLGLVPTMVLLRLLPHVAEQLGGWAVVLTGGAFLALRGFDRAHHHAAARAGRAFIYTALLLHSFTDGVGLAAAIAASADARSVDVTLTLAFVVHRLPEGLFIATTLLPSYGMRRTLLRIAGLVVATVAGGLLGGALLPHLPERVFDAVVALGLGAMLQLVVHSHAERATRPSTRALSSLALLAGVAAAVLVPTPHDLLRAARPRELSMAASLGPLFVETAPAVLVALLLVALGARLPTPRGPAARRRGGIVRGALLGARLSLGPGGAMPAARGLLAQGAPLGAVVAFLVASASLGVDGLLLSARLLGVRWALVRALGAAALALVAGWAAGDRSRPAAAAHAHAHDEPRRASLLDAPMRALDQRGAWYLLGLVAAAALEAALPADGLAGATGAWCAAAAIVLALPLHVALIALMPTCAVLVHKGMSPGAVLALALVAPAVHAHAARLVARISPAAAARVIAALLASALAIGLAARALEPASLPPVHALLGHAPDVLAWIAATLLALGLFASLLRLGPRLWLGQLALLGEPAEEHDHPH